jgi:hypothetical protein
MTNSPEVVTHQVDGETLDEISRAHDELVKCVDWLLSRNDVEAVERLMPIVESIGNRLMAIYEVNYPEIEPCIEAINQFADDIIQRFVQTRRPEDRKFLFKYVTEAISKWKLGSDKLVVELKELAEKNDLVPKLPPQTH